MIGTHIQIIKRMMNSSNGFSASNMAASNGFKRLTRPPSGLLKKAEFLRAVDIAQSEPAINTIVNSEIAIIEQEINLLDKDRKIRQNEGGLQKGYSTAFRKWLRAGGGSKQDESLKVLKQLGAENFETGFKKLWKIACHLDNMVTKISELQIVNFLLYDDMFEDVGSDSQRSSSILSSVANTGYNSGTFQITQVLLDRLKDLFAATRKGTGSTIAKREESKGREQTNQLISQLKSENSKLTALLDQLSAERDAQKRRQTERQKQNTRAKEQKPSTSVLSDEASSKSSFKELQEKYEDQLKYLSSEKQRAEEAVIDLRVKVATLQSKLKSDAQLFKLPNGPLPKSGSYQQALLQQMQKMKKGFQRKIAIMTEQFSTRQRDLRKKEAQYKSENQKIKWQKSLLLKKFEMIPQKL